MSASMLEIRRRVLLHQAKPAEDWDYILTPWDGNEPGWIATKILDVTAGQTIILEGIADSSSNSWLWSSANVTDPASGRTGFGDFRFELPVVKNGKVGISGHYAWADGRQGSGSFFTFAYYIKIKIVD